jgi:hypothetical protein
MGWETATAVESDYHKRLFEEKFCGWRKAMPSAMPI